MVEFFFSEDNNSVDNEEQSSEYFYDVSTSNMLNNITLDILFLLTWNIIFCLDILFYNFYLATLSFSIGFVIGFWNLQQFIKSNTEKRIEMIIFRYWTVGVLWINYTDKWSQRKVTWLQCKLFKHMKPIMLLWNQQWNQ